VVEPLEQADRRSSGTHAATLSSAL
jgi:hypothetical protein